MADYMSWNTPRLKMTQTGPRGTHKMTFRLAPGLSYIDGLAAVTPVIESMLALMLSDTAWAAAEFAAQGSDTFLPVPFTPIPHVSGVEAASNAHEYGRYVNFIGRSAGGSRVAFYLFNVINATQSANNRLTAVENAALTDIFAAFAANSDVIVGIDRNVFTLKPYANTGINDDVAKKSRALV